MHIRRGKRKNACGTGEAYCLKLLTTKELKKISCLQTHRLVVNMFYRSRQLFPQPPMIRYDTIRTFKPHLPLGGIKTTMPTVGVVNQPHRGNFSHVFGRGQRRFFHKWIVPRVDGDRRHANLVEKVLRTGRFIIVIFVLEAIDASNVGLVEGANGGTGTDGVDIKRTRKLFVF